MALSRPQSLRTPPFSLILSLAASLAAGDPPWNPIPFRVSTPANAVFCVGNRVWVADNGGMHESRDGGESWRSLDPFFGRVVQAAYGTDSFFVAVHGNAILRSTDSGRTWIRAEGGQVVLYGVGMVFRARADSLFLETHAITSHRMVSMDHGRSWIRREYSESPAAPDSLEPIPGFRLKLAGGSLARSIDGGNTWDAVPWHAPWGRPLALAAGSGNAYVLSSGLVLRLRGSAEPWEILQPSSQSPEVRQLAVSGNNLCASTDFAFSCSRDGGRHFRTLGRNPFPSTGSPGSRKTALGYGFNLAVDQDRLYLSSLDYYGPNFLWTRSLADTGTWSMLYFSPSTPAFNLTLAAKDGLLALFEGQDSLATLVSTDQGRTFRQLPRIGPIPFIRSAALSASRWALVAGTELLLSPDSGRTWKSQPYRGEATHILLSLTDSSVHTGGMHRFDFRDSTWGLAESPGTILAASDSAWYAVKERTLWVLGFPTAPSRVLSRRPPSRRTLSPDAQVRDILGRIPRHPAGSHPFGLRRPQPDRLYARRP